MKIDDLVVYVHKNKIRVGKCVHKINGDYIIETKSGTYIKRAPYEEQCVSLSLLFQKYENQLKRRK